MLPSSQMLGKEKMRQSGIFDAILMDLLKTYIKPWWPRYRRKLNNMR